MKRIRHLYVDSCLGSFTRFDEGPCYKALRLLTNEVFSKKARLADVQLQGYDIGASIIRIGVWGPLYYSCSNPQTGAGNYQGPKIIARRDPRLFTQSLAFGCQGFTHRLHGSSFLVLIELLWSLWVGCGLGHFCPFVGTPCTRSALN